MGTTQIGARVFAVRSADDNTINLFGFGTYAGDHPRPATDAETAELAEFAADAVRHADANPLDVTTAYDHLVADGTLTREAADEELRAAAQRIAEEQARPIEERAAALTRTMLNNPRVDLDEGGHVWGYECWWGPEERFAEFAKGRTVNTVGAPERP